MTREWQAGDVAMLTVPDHHRDGRADPSPWHIGIRDNVGEWVSGTAFGRRLKDNDVAEARPLVVIDPEDREQVERLAHLFYEAGKPLVGWSGDAMQAALREFADPQSPRPDEPLLLGAVIEDNECEVWVRADVGLFAWRRTGISGDEYKSYAQINAVRVLSPGYDPEATT